MYDKYQTGNTFTTGGTTTPLPKHKGIYLSSGATANTSFYLYNSQGNTFLANVTFGIGDSVFPFRVYSVFSLASGQTGFYIN